MSDLILLVRCPRFTHYERVSAKSIREVLLKVSVSEVVRVAQEDASEGMVSNTPIRL